MDEKTLKDKLRELFEKIKQEQWSWNSWNQLIREENGEAIFCQSEFSEKIISYGYDGYGDTHKLNYPVLELVQDILHLAFEFTQE